MKSYLLIAKKEFLSKIAIILVSAISFGFLLKTLKSEDLLASPVITSFAPTSAERMPATVIITGSNFSNLIDENEVMFNGVPAKIVSATSSQLITVIPKSATSGKITLTVSGITITSASDFIVKKRKADIPYTWTNTSFRINSKSRLWVKEAS